MLVEDKANISHAAERSRRENVYVVYVHALICGREWHKNYAPCTTEDHLNDSFSNNNGHAIVPQKSNFDLT